MGFEYYQVRSGDWDRLNLALREIFRNLDIRTGNAGVTPQFDSIDMQGNSIIGGPEDQSGILATDFITKGYLATDEFTTLVESLSATVEVASTFEIEDSATAILTNLITLTHRSTGTVAAGFGGSILYNLENSGKVWSEAGSLNVLWSDATIGSEDSVFSVKLKTAGSALAEQFRITSLGRVGIRTTSPDYILHVVDLLDATASFDTQKDVASPAPVRIYHDRGQANVANADIVQLVFAQDSTTADAAVKTSIQQVMIDRTVATGAALAFSTGGIGNAKERLRITNLGLVGIGTSLPDGMLHVMTATAGTVTPDADGDDLIVENSGDAGLSILAPDASNSSIIFGSPTDAYGAGIVWNYTSKQLNLKTQTASGYLSLSSANNSESVRIGADGNVGIGTVGAAAKLAVNGGVHVGGDASVADNNLRVDGMIEINTATGEAALNVNGGAHIGGDSNPGDNNLAVDGVILCQSNQVITARQAAEGDAGAVSAITLNAGTDLVDRAAFNTALSSMVTEMNGIKSTLNSLLAKLRTHGLIAT